MSTTLNSNIPLQNLISALKVAASSELATSAYSQITQQRHSKKKRARYSNRLGISDPRHINMLPKCFRDLHDVGVSAFKVKLDLLLTQVPGAPPSLPETETWTVASNFLIHRMPRIRGFLIMALILKMKRFN